MSTLCSLSHCRCISRALCYVCHESFCREHFDEHDHSFHFLLKSLNGKVKDFDDRLEELNDEELIENCYEQLEKWRDESYQSIDRLYQKKCEEMKERFQTNINRRQERINKLQMKINELLQEEDISKNSIHFLLIDIESVKEEMKKLEETIFHLDIHPLLIDDHYIKIEERNETHLNLTQITYPYHIIDYSNYLSKPLASNEQYLLIFRMQHLHIINRELISIKQISWLHGRIWDLTWSQIFKRFLIIAHYEVYSLNVETMSIERLERILRRNWWSCTCSDSSLFLSTYEQGSSIMEFSLQPSIQLIKQWKSPQTCSKDEWIKDIVYNNETIALTIDNKKTSIKRIELRSIEKLNSLWSLELDIRHECRNTLRCCSLPENQWLVADFDNQRLLHIREDGKLQTTYPYIALPCYVNLFYPNLLVISTDKGVNFHKL